MKGFTMSRIVIIGGMGPQASLSLHQRIIDAAVLHGATNNEDFPEITHVSIPVADFIADETNKTFAASQILSALERRGVWLW